MTPEHAMDIEKTNPMLN